MYGFTPHEQELAAGDGILASMIAQLDELKAFLLKHKPPVSEYGPTVAWKFVTDIAEVDQIAATIGAEASWNKDGTQYRVERKFGKSVSYEALYIGKRAEQDDPADAEDAPELAAVAA